jgi:thiamine kinase-like enzyme
VDAIGTALAVQSLPSVPCHNDLLAENFIATGDGVRIIDYQLSGNNDPAFELGDIAAEADYDPDLVGLLAGEYFAGADEALRSRVRLYQIASNVTWTLWFTVHHGLLSAGNAAAFDYAAEAAEKWGQAKDALDDDPGLGRLLAAVTGRTPHP